ncbi:hypothetical protein D3C75_195690 [compost metagenome]
MNLNNRITRILGVGLLSAGLLAGGTILPANHSWAASAASKTGQTSIVLKVNGKISTQQGIYQNGKVWIPVSFLNKTLGMPLSYDKADSSYTIGKGTNPLKLSVNEYGVFLAVNGHYLSEYDGLKYGGHLYVPFGVLNDYLGYKGDFSKSEGRLNITSRKLNALTVTTETYAKTTEGYTINLKYPQIVGLANAEAQKAINNTLKQTFQTFSNSINSSLKERDEDIRPYDFESDYVVTYNENGVLSLVMDQYEYLGGAHGGTYRQGFTFSLKDGKRLLLGDLFGANPNYKKVLNTKVSEAFKKSRDYYGYTGGFTGLQTEKYFYVQEGRVTLFFQQYDYTPYAAGFPQFTFSFKDILPDGSSPFDRLK